MSVSLLPNLICLVSYASTWQGPLDSILHYPMYNALVQAFQIPGPQNMSAMVDTIAQAKKMFKASIPKGMGKLVLTSH